MLSDAHKIVRVAAIIGVFGSFCLFVVFILAEWSNPNWTSVSFNHFAATVGLPSAAAGAFIIVALFRTTEGQIKFEGLGFKFEGASGPIIMRVICFLSIAGAIKLVWPLTLP
ncbi:hypothetical protein ACQ86E_29700 [Bradyrhizobium betae]|uniref:hypothetical protein n=1 Tax=Bradyrhizobium betae TaxID=244734 RepID=UPI003D66F944